MGDGAISCIVSFLVDAVPSCCMRCRALLWRGDLWFLATQVVHQEKSGDEKKGEKTDSDSKEQAESMEVDEGADAGEKKSSSKGKGKGKEEQVLRTRVCTCGAVKILKSLENILL